MHISQIQCKIYGPCSKELVLVIIDFIIVKLSKLRSTNKTFTARKKNKKNAWHYSERVASNSAAWARVKSGGSRVQGKIFPYSLVFGTVRRANCIYKSRRRVQFRYFIMNFGILLIKHYFLNYCVTCSLKILVALFPVLCPYKFLGCTG